MKKSRTKLESFLFWWLVANCIIFPALIVLIVIAAIADPAVVKITTQGTSSLLLAFFAILSLFGIWAFLAWKMRTPSSRTLLFGMLFFLLASIYVQYPGGIIRLNPVLAVHITLLSEPSFIVKLDIVADFICILFAVAWRQKISAKQNTPASVSNNDTSVS